MSTGRWLPKDNPPDNQPRSLLAQIAQRFEEIAALDSKRAQINGELSQLFRSAEGKEKGDAPTANRRVA